MGSYFRRGVFLWVSQNNSGKVEKTKTTEEKSFVAIILLLFPQSVLAKACQV
jgi:hypothetical protein